MKLWTLHSTEAPTGTVAQSTRESQEANDGLISVREPFVAIVATVSVLCSRAAALAARDNELFNWVGKWEKRWNFYDNHIFGSSGKNSLLSKWLMLWFSACFTFLINMSKGGHDLKRSLSSSSLSSSNPWPDLSKILAKRSFFFSSFSSSPLPISLKLHMGSSASSSSGLCHLLLWLSSLNRLFVFMQQRDSDVVAGPRRRRTADTVPLKNNTVWKRSKSKKSR